MPSSSLYNDFLTMQSKKGTQVKESVRQRAYSAANALGLPVHSICTDKRGEVLEVASSFLNFTGYAKNEMVGRKCGFLQGEGTDPDDVMELRLAMQAERKTSVVILNYRKDGSPFWNVLSINPQPDHSNGFKGVIVGLPIPKSMQPNPKLCLEDAMALISVVTSIPPSIPLLGDQRDDSVVCDEAIESDSTASVEDSSPPKYKNYAQILKNEKLSLTEEPNIFEFVAETNLPTAKGRFRVRAYRNPVTGEEPMALIVGDIEGKEDVTCRVHDQCVTSEVFGSVKCDCKQQLDHTLELIQSLESGVLLYLPQEGRGIGLANKIAAYGVQELGFDTVDANRHLGLPDDAREYTSVRDILSDLNIKSVNLLTNNPRKIKCLETLGVVVSRRTPCICKPNSVHSRNYVEAKAARMGHMINMSSLREAQE